MRITLPVLLALLIALPAHAEHLKPPGWNTGNNLSAGNPRVAGNKIISVEDEKARKAKVSQQIVAQNTTAKGEKPKVIRNASGTTSIQNVYKSQKRKWSKTTLGQVWSDLFN